MNSFHDLDQATTVRSAPSAADITRFSALTWCLAVATLALLLSVNPVLAKTLPDFENLVENYSPTVVNI